MHITVNERNILQIQKLFVGLELKSDAGEKMHICMRDSGFEFRYNGVWYEAKGGQVTRMIGGKADQPIDIAIPQGTKPAPVSGHNMTEQLFDEALYEKEKLERQRNAEKNKLFTFSYNKLVNRYCKEVNTIFHDHSYMVALESFAEWLESSKQKVVSNTFLEEAYRQIAAVYNDDSVPLHAQNRLANIVLELSHAILPPLDRNGDNVPREKNFDPAVDELEPKKIVPLVKPDPKEATYTYADIVRIWDKGVSFGKHRDKPQRFFEEVVDNILSDRNITPLVAEKKHELSSPDTRILPPLVLPYFTGETVIEFIDSIVVNKVNIPQSVREDAGELLVKLLKIKTNKAI